MRTGDSSSTHVVTNPASPTFNHVVGMQIRNQHDRDSILDYQFEPVWKFASGPVTHTLLTGFEYVHEIIDTQRTTADLANIPNAFGTGAPDAIAEPVRVPIR
jgi:iron complex outermembrane receptor protein